MEVRRLFNGNMPLGSSDIEKGGTWHRSLGEGEVDHDEDSEIKRDFDALDPVCRRSYLINSLLPGATEDSSDFLANSSKHQHPTTTRSSQSPAMEAPEHCDSPVTQAQGKYKQLQSQIMAAIEGCDSPKEILAAASQAIQELLSGNAELHEEIVDLKYDIESNDGYTRELRQSHKLLRAEHDAVLSKLQSGRTNLEIIRAKLEVTEAQLRNLQLEEEEASGEWAFAALGRETELRLGLEKEVKELRVEVKELRQDRDQKEPLVKVGVDIRLRFLELSKEHIPLQKKVKVDKEVLELGNRAAHGGFGEADGSLFSLGVFLATSLKSATQTYKNLYLNDPSTFKSGSPQLREVINHQVTIRTLKARNNGLNRPIIERQRTMEHIDIVMEKCAKLKDEALIAADTDIQRRIILIRGATTEIIELDRREQSRSQFLKENRRPGKSERSSSAGFGLC